MSDYYAWTGNHMSWALYHLKGDYASGGVRVWDLSNCLGEEFLCSLGGETPHLKHLVL